MGVALGNKWGFLPGEKPVVSQWKIMHLIFYHLKHIQAEAG